MFPPGSPHAPGSEVSDCPTLSLTATAHSSMRPECGTHLDIRIGLHSGSVLSGLLGLRKWTLDVWSADTQKTARLEQEGQAGWIHTTPTILHSLPDSLLRLLRVTGGCVTVPLPTELSHRPPRAARGDNLPGEEGRGHAPLRTTDTTLPARRRPLGSDRGNRQRSAQSVSGAYE